MMINGDSETTTSDLNMPFNYFSRQNSTGGKSFKSVQTSFTEKGHGWECKDCAMLNGLECAACELCGAQRHVNVCVDININAGTVKKNKVNGVVTSKTNNCSDANDASPCKLLNKKVDMHKRSPSGTTAEGSKSSRDSSKQSESSKKSNVDPPAHNVTVGGNCASNKNATANDMKNKRKTRRASLFHFGLKGNRKVSNIDMKVQKHHEPIKQKESPRPIKNKNESKVECIPPVPISSVAAAIAALSPTPLQGEKTTQAIAQLLDLSTAPQDTNCINTDGGSTVDNSKNSGGSSHHKSAKSDTAATKQDSKNKEKQHTRRTTFSHEVSDISNGIKLKKKIQGDRDRVDRWKAIKRGEVVEQEQQVQTEMEASKNDELANGMIKSELSASAKISPPVTSIDTGDGKGKDAKVGSKAKKKKEAKNSEGKRESTHDESLHKKTGEEAATDGKPVKKSSKKKKKEQHHHQQQHQQSKTEGDTDTNPTLQATQGPKQEKKAPGTAAKNKKDKPDQNNSQSVDDKPKHHKKEKRKPQVSKSVDDSKKLDKPMKKADKSKHSINKDPSNRKIKAPGNEISSSTLNAE